ncbi:methylated-DNA--[protein]-cysteine S-methyltransferase [Paenibacillus agaridevorans]|uniref:methylated-DNA--[protein]-cysteine S-methyltransferase n=1 Tax=Paenibacillus agaridevorans TaxID=171404 RepID=UPI001BE498F2|nr:methylated-DNA--[protein]-cysteine S-methyltransferase [Paenibacillus agaridevorans]
MITKNSSPIYWSLLTCEEWRMYIAAIEEGLCFVGSQNQPFEEFSTWATSRLPGREWVQDEQKLQPYANEIIAYLQGKLSQFTLPLFYRGTPFQEAVWKALQNIPYGQTRSYSEIAAHIHNPAAIRAVGSAIGANPVLITIPCHRVIGKNGSLAGYRGGVEMKSSLLRLEQQA